MLKMIKNIKIVWWVIIKNYMKIELINYINKNNYINKIKIKINKYYLY